MLDNSAGQNSLELKPWVKISPKAPPTLIIHAMNDPVDDVREPMAVARRSGRESATIKMRIRCVGDGAGRSP